MRGPSAEADALRPLITSSAFAMRLIGVSADIRAATLHMSSMRRTSSMRGSLTTCCIATPSARCVHRFISSSSSGIGPSCWYRRIAFAFRLRGFFEGSELVRATATSCRQ